MSSSTPTPPPSRTRDRRRTRPSRGRGKDYRIFPQAQQAAEQRLAEAIKERAEIEKRLPYLYAEIDSLIGIIRALKQSASPLPYAVVQPATNGASSYPSIPKPITMADIMSDEVLPQQAQPAPAAPHVPLVDQMKVPEIPQRAFGGAMDTSLAAEEDEDVHLKQSEMSGGTWI